MIPRYFKQPFVVTGACMSAYIIIFVFMTGLVSPRLATLAAVVGVGALGVESLYRGILARFIEKLGPMVPWILFALLGYAVLPLIPYAGSRAWNNLTGVVYGISIFLVVRQYGRIAFIEPLYMSYVFIVLCLFILFPGVLGVEAGQERLRLSAEALGEEKGLNPNDVARLMGISGLMILGSLKGFNVKLLTRGPAIERALNALKIAGVIAAVYVIMFHSGSRAALAWVAAMFGYIVAAYYNRSTVFSLLIAGAMGLSGLVLTYFIFPEIAVFNRIAVLFDEVAMRGEGEKSLYTRMHMIQEAIGLWMQSPVWGNGNEAYRVEGSYGTYSHSNYTELLANYGVLGFMFFYFPVGWGALTAWKMRKSVNEDIRKLAIWVVICCGMLFVVSFVNVIYYTKYVLLFYAFLLGKVYYIKDHYQQFNRLLSPRHVEVGGYANRPR